MFLCILPEECYLVLLNAVQMFSLVSELHHSFSYLKHRYILGLERIGLRRLRLDLFRMIRFFQQFNFRSYIGLLLFAGSSMSLYVPLFM